jgi:uncharacterized protein YbbC (DUF1343 family)
LSIFDTSEDSKPCGRRCESFPSSGRLFHIILLVVPNESTALSNRAIVGLDEVASEMRKVIKGKASISRITMTTSVDKRALEKYYAANEVDCKREREISEDLEAILTILHVRDKFRCTKI